jgi:hypothetical protein
MEVSGQLHAPAALPPGEIATGTHWIGEWGGLQRQSGRCGVEKNLTPVGNVTPVVQPEIRVHSNTSARLQWSWISMGYLQPRFQFRLNHYKQARWHIREEKLQKCAHKLRHVCLSIRNPSTAKWIFIKFCYCRWAFTTICQNIPILVKTGSK